MNPPVPNELISAYFDGEASPEERAAVESLLDGSTVTRRELDEISQLSALLHSFPRESAPAELVANVRRQTDQLPLVAQAVPVVSARSRRREWTAAALGAVVTAAALMLMVNLTDRDGSRSAADRLAELGNAKGGVPSFHSPATPAEAESIVSTGGQPRFGMKSGDESEDGSVTATT
ncbi:MAG: zf-HC2 domain-containing protein, partial [Candidatus Saccharimonas sp.]|nr:zf-HC2 domain-containing protein [Planctomycetaceae bacterium]